MMWNGDEVYRDLRRQWQLSMADATHQRRKAEEAKKAGRIPSAYEDNHDEAWARACVYA